MKVSEMTNKELAKNAEEFANAFHNESDKAILREAAKRLRRPTPVDDDLLKMARDIDRLTARLKVAEYALGESRVAVCHICNLKHTCGHGTSKFDPCCIRKDIDGALAAIRGERN